MFAGLEFVGLETRRWNGTKSAFADSSARGWCGAGLIARAQGGIATSRQSGHPRTMPIGAPVAQSTRSNSPVPTP